MSNCFDAWANAVFNYGELTLRVKDMQSTALQSTESTLFLESGFLYTSQTH